MKNGIFPPDLAGMGEKERGFDKNFLFHRMLRRKYEIQLLAVTARAPLQIPCPPPSLLKEFGHWWLHFQEQWSDFGVFLKILFNNRF